MTRTNWPVGNEGIRPRGPRNRCFYCNQPLGSQHLADGSNFGGPCAIRRRTVVVRGKNRRDRVVDVPENWTAAMIDGYEFDYWIELTGLRSAKFVREATAEDEDRDAVKVCELPS